MLAVVVVEWWSGGPTVAPRVRRSKVTSVKMSSTSSRFPTRVIACKFPQIRMKCSLLHHQARPGERELLLFDELPHRDLPIIDY